MLADYEAYAQANHVLPVPDDYDQRRQVIFYTLRNNPNYFVLGSAAAIVLLLLYLTWRGVRWSWRRIRT